MVDGWRTVGSGLGYLERRYDNKKVGHVHSEPTSRSANNKPAFDEWKGFLDGNYVGVAELQEDAQMLVDRKYKERYG